MISFHVIQGAELCKDVSRQINLLNAQSYELSPLSYDPQTRTRRVEPKIKHSFHYL